MTSSGRTRTHLRRLVFLLAPFLAVPADAYDDVSLSASAIRDAYFLGSREGGLRPDFLARYAHWVPTLKQWTCTSQVRLETPYLQVADFASKAVNYSSQDAVEQFYGKAMYFRMYLDICYRPRAPLNTIKVKVMQNKKEIASVSAQSSPYYPVIRETAILPANGERITLEFNSGQFDSSTLTILIDTLDQQHAAVEFELQGLR